MTTLKRKTDPTGFDQAVRFPDWSELNMLQAVRGNSEAHLKEAIAAHLVRTYERPIRRVLGYQEHTVYGGGCSTCVYSEVVLDAYFKDSSGRTLVWRFSGDFGQLVRMLSPQAVSQ